MPHLLEPASSGRSRCRGCSRAIDRGELRFGERIPNPFAEGETTLWFHPRCAAFKRPEPLLETLDQAKDLPDQEALTQLARASTAHRRLPRVDGAERAPSTQAKCRSCKEPIQRGTWRIRLVFFQEGRFTPGGFVHLDCRDVYFEKEPVLERLIHFSQNLDESAREELMRACEASPS